MLHRPFLPITPAGQDFFKNYRFPCSVKNESPRGSKAHHFILKTSATLKKKKYKLSNNDFTTDHLSGINNLKK